MEMIRKLRREMETETDPATKAEMEEDVRDLQVHKSRLKSVFMNSPSV
jgi:hypothetical protein